MKKDLLTDILSDIHVYILLKSKCIENDWYSSHTRMICKKLIYRVLLMFL